MYPGPLIKSKSVIFSKNQGPVEKINFTGPKILELYPCLYPVQVLSFFGPGPETGLKGLRYDQNIFVFILPINIQSASVNSIQKLVDPNTDLFKSLESLKYGQITSKTFSILRNSVSNGWISYDQAMTTIKAQELILADELIQLNKILSIENLASISKNFKSHVKS